MFVICDVDLLGRRILELQQVERGQVAGGVVEEHVFRARVGCADRAGGRAGVPVVHRGVEVQAGIGRCPGGIGDLFPEVTGLQRLHHAAIAAGGQIPVAVIFDSAQEIVLQRDGVVGVLTRDGEIGFRIPVGVVGLEIKILVALLGELDDALDVVFRNWSFLAARISRFKAGFSFGSKQAPLAAVQFTQAFMIALRCLATILEPVTRAATFCSSFTFQSI